MKGLLKGMDVAFKIGSLFTRQSTDVWRERQGRGTALSRSSML